MRFSRWRKRLPYYEQKVLYHVREIAVYCEFADSKPEAARILQKVVSEINKAQRENNIKVVR